MIHKKVDYATIAAAKNGDLTAMCRILRHYEQYIASFSTRAATDEYGNVLRFVAHEIADRIKAKLMFSIFYYFDLNSIPPEKGGR